MSKVRTRFAPSPTGRMHVGNLRTALYAYLVAKHEGGDFILRIEDTDQERYVEGAVDIIYRTLQKTGLIHDEGPDKDLSLIHISAHETDPYLVCRLSDKPQIVLYKGVFCPFVTALRRNTELLVSYLVHHLPAAPSSASAPARLC